MREFIVNTLFITLAILLAILIPTYIGMYISTVLVINHLYPTQEMQWMLILDPVRMVTTLVRDIFYNYYLPYSETYAFPFDFKIKMFAPTISGFVVGLVFVFLMRAPLTDFRPIQKKESLHGDSKWASETAIRKMGLRAKRGALLGKTKDGKYLICNDFQHILLFAPTGSGKGVGVVLPNLLFWEESIICHDIKLENFELTSGYRSKVLKQECYVWNPADPDGNTHCYNPLDWISKKPGQMVDDSQKICNLILPEQEFWNNEARSLMLGVILYLVAVPEKEKSFGEVVRTMRSDDVVYNLAVVLDTIGKKIHPVSYMNIAAFLQKADKERSGVISTLNSGLELWANPLIDTATSKSDFNIAEFKKKKVTVYCGVTPDNLQRLEPLLKVFYQQATDFLTRKMPGDDEPHGVMFIMDEFPSLGEMPQFQTGIAYFRGYHVKLLLIVQDTQQLKGIYEEAGMNSFLSNSYYRITFSANNVETANLISQLVGNKTVKQHSLNKPRFLDLNPASRTVHESETQRALLLPQEVIQLPRDDEIILVESQPPIRCKKIKYYADRFFKKRLLPPVPVPQQEPYDPRKKAPQPSKPKPKGKPGLPPLRPPPPPGGAPGAKPGGAPFNPFDLPLPPLKPPGAPGAAPPPGFPPPPGTPPGAPGAPPAAKPGAPFNPFDLPLPPLKPPGAPGAAPLPAAAPAAAPASPAPTGTATPNPSAQAAPPPVPPAAPPAATPAPASATPAAAPASPAPTATATPNPSAQAAPPAAPSVSTAPSPSAPPSAGEQPTSPPAAPNPFAPPPAPTAPAAPTPSAPPADTEGKPVDEAAASAASVPPAPPPAAKPAAASPFGNIPAFPFAPPPPPPPPLPTLAPKAPSDSPGASPAAPTDGEGKKEGGAE